MHSLLARRSRFFPLLLLSLLFSSSSPLLLPPSSVIHPPADTPPRAVLHFLPGSFLSPSPSLYDPFCKSLASLGYLVVKTPYPTTATYLPTTDSIISSFEALAPSLAQKYGALPVVGIGHSLGALHQTLVGSLFPDTPRAGNVMIAWNARSLSDSIPESIYEPLVIPFSKELAKPRVPPTVQSLKERVKTGKEVEPTVRAIDMFAATGEICSITKYYEILNTQHARGSSGTLEITVFLMVLRTVLTMLTMVATDVCRRLT